MIQEIIGDTKRPVKIWATSLEAEARAQVRNLASLPFIHKHVAVMPDAHAGKGSTVGTVIATKGAIIPAAVGVDIGCGMCAVKLGFKIDLFNRLPELRSAIEAVVPVGFTSNPEPTDRVLDTLIKMGPLRSTEGISINKVHCQMGSLGGGNHFIEICQDQRGDAWVMLHSGSRNVGKTLADVHINRAKGLMKQYFIELPDPDLAYLAQDTQEFKDYIADLHWAQTYAQENRNEMMLRVMDVIHDHLFEGLVQPIPQVRVDCHHNYTAMENHFGHNVWVTRKGAVSARMGELGIVPGSMGTKSFIVSGRGNEESFNSCSHGAGRRMSRTKAKLMFSQTDLIEQTFGVECRKDSDVIDEIPGAYKNIDDVMENQADLVGIVFELKQIMCIKG